MKVIEPSFEPITVPDAKDKEGVYKFLEMIGRVCYKSEGKITDDSYKNFLKMILDRGHLSVMEHFIFVLEVPKSIYFSYDKKIPDIPYKAEFKTQLSFIKKSIDGKRYFISLSAATANNLIGLMNPSAKMTKALLEILDVLYTEYPLLIKANYELKEYSYEKSHIPFFKKYKINILSRDEIEKLSEQSRLIHDFTTIKFIFDRGCSHEIVRHRPASYCQESTRYCNYSNDKFGSDITFIKPVFFEEGSKEYNSWKSAMEDSEHTYMDLINMGATPQEARTVLPNSLKTEIYVTARLIEWKHILKIRTGKTVHPQMLQVMNPLKNYFIEKYVTARLIEFDPKRRNGSKLYIINEWNVYQPMVKQQPQILPEEIIPSKQ